VRHSLKDVIDAALARPSWRAFGPALEDRYEAAGGAARRARLRATLVVAALSLIAPLALETRHTQAVLLDNLAWRAGGTALVLAAALAAPRIRTPLQEAALVAFAALSGVVVVGLLGERGPPAMVGVFLIAALAFVAGVIASGQVRFLTAVATSVACAMAFWLITRAFPETTRAGGDAGMPGAAFIGLAIVCVAARRNEITRRSEFLYRLRHEVVEAEMKAMNAELLRLSTTDLLTGLPNRRHFETEARRIWDDRDKAPFALGIVDIDHFKAFNDAAGHAAGDACLIAVARAMKGSLRRDKDHVARYGGEEFAVLFPGAQGPAAETLGERLRKAVEAAGIPHPGRPGEVVTVSVGITWKVGRGGNLDAVIGEADRLLYRAKETGRNSTWASAAGLDEANITGPAVPATASADR
jgi:diguanylate cyclase (GGDEF)-like protein